MGEKVILEEKYLLLHSNISADIQILIRCVSKLLYKLYEIIIQNAQISDTFCTIFRYEKICTTFRNTVILQSENIPISEKQFTLILRNISVFKNVDVGEPVSGKPTNT